MKGFNTGDLKVLEMWTEEVRVTIAVLLFRGEIVTSAARFSTAAAPTPGVLRAYNAFKY